MPKPVLEIEGIWNFNPVTGVAFKGWRILANGYTYITCRENVDAERELSKLGVALKKERRRMRAVSGGCMSSGEIEWAGPID